MPKPRKVATTYETVERLARLKNLLREAPLAREQIARRMREYAEDRTFRMLRRDLIALRHLGFENAETDGGIRLSARTVEVDWNRDELQAMAALRDCFGEDAPYASAIHSILERITAGMNEETRRIYARRPPLAIRLEASRETPRVKGVQEKLERALEHHQRVAFKYYSSERQRVIAHPDDEPLRLEFREGHYYLEAHCFKMNNVFDYRVDQILPDSVEILPSRAVGQWKRKLVPFQYRVSPKIAQRGITLRFPVIEAIESDGERPGWMRVTAAGYDKFRIIREILRYGEQAEIVSPDWLRAEMKKVVAKMEVLYAGE